MGPPGNRNPWGHCVLTNTQTTSKKAYERYQGHLMWLPTYPGPRAVPESRNGQTAPDCRHSTGNNQRLQT
ncbi:unnamed protein product [Staurois parvus]|uniref:Uncharacterized protein n=1 Tax=Staurois parvus TaxID=386267 RepID=A0ABN9DKD8_9NEOB|nr:unnamed protein product [Staurois parvus]